MEFNDNFMWVDNSWLKLNKLCVRVFHWKRHETRKKSRAICCSFNLMCGKSEELSK